MSAPAVDAALLAVLRRQVRGTLRFTDHDRLLYATDASLYQVTPLGVICPADADDLQAAVRVCAERRVPMLPRGGGTSLAGQCTNGAVVLDVSPSLRAITDIDSATRTVHAQAGATLDEINRHLLKATSGRPLFFAPDPATAAQASVGGCIGNNAAGTRSIKYGRTSENVAAVDVILADGERVTLRRGATHPRAVELATRVAGVVLAHAALIRQRFPKTIRRNAGYGLDLILQQLDAGVAPADLDLTGLLCGSEGTLAITVGATLKLHPLPLARGMAVASFPTVGSAIDVVAAINASGATAVELLDEVVLAAAANNRECQPYLSRLPPIDGNSPAAVLQVEYEAVESTDELQAAFARLSAVLPPGTPTAFYPGGQGVADLWALRKAAEPLLHSIGGGPDGRRKPHTFVEDNAVPVERLGEFVRGFRQIVERHGTTAAYYAHASVGVLHVRPLIDLHASADRDALRGIAADVADLARECGGVMSGEHGDGRVRGPLLHRLYGPELMAAFAQVKAIFDPHHLLNPGNIVSPGPVESITQNLRIERQRLGQQLDAVDTYFDYADQHGLGGAVEMCNGAGVCRKTAGGTMCPSYRATLDERHSTRGRGNALRLAVTGQFGHDAAPRWDDPGTIETLDLCLSCKACKSECPSNVDVARLKAEYTAQRYRTTGPTLQARLFGHVRTLNRWASVAPGLANAVVGFGPVRAVMNRLLNLSPRRSLPPFARSLRSRFGRRPRTASDRPRVVLYEDCFTGFNEPHIAVAAVELLERLGYEVLLPRVGCCGRAMISTGLLPDAMAAAERTLGVLAPHLEDPWVKAVLFLEPSCWSSVADDWLQLKLGDASRSRARQLADKAMLAEHFVSRFWPEHPIRPADVEPMSTPLVLHGHCHQKALLGEASSADALRRVSSNVTVLPTGCCGMAGSFGFTQDRYELSMKIGEGSLFPLVRDANADAVIVAPGTSCRHQIHDGTSRRAVHPIEVLASHLLEQSR
jgi:FAD/FMN-containing dehydrogenase/Fe-S oxidoreductase